MIGASTNRVSPRGDRNAATKLHAESFSIEEIHKHNLIRNNNSADTGSSPRKIIDKDRDRDRDPIINVDDDSTHHKISLTTKSVLSAADILKTLFFVLVWYTFSLFLTL